VAADQWNTHVLGVAPYARADLDVGPVTVTPGMRLETSLIQGSRSTPRVGATPGIGFTHLDAVLEPRIAVRVRPAPPLLLSAAAGIYHAPPAPEDLSAVFGTPDLTLSSARHASVGQTLDLTETTRLEVVEYYESLSRLPVRSRRAAPVLARSLVQDGEGRNFGIQMLLRQEAWRGFSGFVAYTVSRSERRYAGDEAARLFDYDRTHVVSVVATQEVSTWSFGGRLQVASGLPRTPVVDAYYDVRTDRYDPLFGAQNSIRLPAFFELDLRVDRRFALGKDRSLRLYVEVDNVTARRNAEEIVYDHAYQRRAFITGMPPLGVLGARLDF